MLRLIFCWALCFKILLLFHGCAGNHRRVVINASQKQFILQTQDRTSIQIKSPRFFVSQEGEIHVAAVSFEGQDSERLEYFEIKQEELKHLQSFSWHRLFVHQWVKTTSGVWLVITGKQNKTDKHQQIFLLALDNKSKQLGLSSLALEVPQEEQINPKAVWMAEWNAICLSYEVKKGRHWGIQLSCLDAITGMKSNTIELSSKNILARRPSMVVHDSRLVIAWDEWQPRRRAHLSDPDYDVQLAYVSRHKNSIKLEKKNKILSGEALTAAPFLSSSGKDLWLAFHTNQTQALLKHWQLVRIAGKELMHDGRHESSLHADAHEENQGNEFPLLSHRWINDQDAFLLLSRPSHGAKVTIIRGGLKEELNLDQDGWGARDLTGQIEWYGEKRFIVARRGHKQSVVEIFDLPNLENEKLPLIVMQKFDSHVPAPKAIHRIYIRPASFKNLHFGDVHTHSGYSDGTGPNDEIYARHYSRGLDFSILTDHDNIVGSRLFPSQHAENQQVTDWFDDLADFTTLQAFEWTTPPIPRGHGHKNIYFSGNSINPVLSFKGNESDVAKLYESMKGWEAFAAAHHSGWTGINWSDLNEAYEPQFEIASVHGVYENLHDNPFKTRGDLPGTFARDGLALGKKIHFMAGSDAHGLISHHGNGRHLDPWGHGLTGIRLKKITRKKLWQSLQRGESWATTGEMARVEQKLLKKQDRLFFDYTVETVSPIQSIQLIIDGIQVLDQTLGNLPLLVRGAIDVQTYLLDGKEHSMYLRILTKDQNSNIEAVFSSPLFTHALD